jgi:lipopolysaccharide cholinephosphotransferase
MKGEIALNNLIELDKIFKNNKSEYWLSCGTLLGVYRDGDFIGHDTDTDLCLNIHSLDKKLINDILTNGFKVKHVFGRIKDGFEITIEKDNVKTDIFLFYKNENKWYHSVYDNFTGFDCVKYDYIFNKFNITEITFKNYNFCIPLEVEDVITQQYGKRWREIDKNWLYSKSPYNIVNTQIRIPISESKNDLKKLIN